MSAPTETELRIRGEFTPDPNVCRFVVSKQLFDDDWTFQFNSPADAPGSALIAALFEVEGVSEIRVLRDTFTSTKNSQDPWPALAGKLIPVMRQHLAGDASILDAGEREAMKDAPLEDDVQGVIAELLEQQINPALASHGGFVTLQRIEGHDVYVEMGGGCQGCASSRSTMKFGIERAIKEAVPQVQNVIDAPDHEAGSNPYYS